MPTIKDTEYKQFLETGLISIIDKESFEKMLGNVEHPKDTKQARALFILLFYSGRRPAELLELQAQHIKKERRHIKLLLPTKKKGRYSLIYLPLNQYTKEIWEYASNKFPEQYLFWLFRGNNVKRVRYKTKDGIKEKQYIEISKKLWYWIKKWCGVTPYFFRHNRLSDLALKGADPLELMYYKGASDARSVMKYMHMSSARAKKIARYLKF